MSAWGPAAEVDEGVERHGADWQGIKEPYQLELMPSMDAIRPWGHHAIRMKDAFWPWIMAVTVLFGTMQMLFSYLFLPLSNPYVSSAFFYFSLISLFIP